MIFVSIDSDNESMFSMLWNFPWIPNRPFHHVRQPGQFWSTGYPKMIEVKSSTRTGGVTGVTLNLLSPTLSPLDHGVCWS